MPAQLPLRSPLARAMAALGALALSACGDGGGNPAAPGPVPPTRPVELARVACTADVRQKAVACAPPQGLSGDARGLIVGGQGVYVQVTTSNAAFEPGDNVFSFDLQVANLIPQPMGTADGTTPSAAGVRVVFHQPPTTTGGSGSVSVVNPDGQATYTATNQDYFEYAGTLLGADGILSRDETSETKPWELSLDEGVTAFTFSLYVVADVPFPNGWVDVSPPADSLQPGATQLLAGTVRNAVGAAVPGQAITWGTSNAGVATVDAAGRVTAVAPGTATITATAGARTGSAAIAVCPGLAVGGVYVVEMPAGSELCLAGGATGAEYAVVPVNTSGSSVSLSLTGAGIVPVSGPPTPSRLVPGGLRGPAFARGARDDAFELRLRRMERRDLTGRMAAARAAIPGGRPRKAGGARRAIVPGVPAVGALMTLNVETDNSCGTFDARTGRVVAVGTRVIVIADTLNPAGGLSAADYQAIADSFDAVIHPTVTAGFDDPATPAGEGAPTDIDGNGRVIAFYTRAVNELTPPGSPSYVGGFVFSRDLYPASECPTSNVGEMFYMLAADPAGAVNGNARSVAFVREKTLGTLAHEFAHMINASRRLYVNPAVEFEETWLDEGLAHVAEEMVFHQAAGVAAGADLGAADVFDGGRRQDAFFKYAESNFGRLRQWLLSPHASGLFQDDDDLATRGAAWAFLRYASDRDGDAAFFSALLNGTVAGMDNLQAVLGTDPLPWVRDFGAAIYVDGTVGGPAAEHTLPSWNYRDVYANLDYDPGVDCSCAYELAVRDPANGVADAFTLAGGGAAAYARMGVSAGAFAGVTVLSGGSAPPATVRLAIIRRG